MTSAGGSVWVLKKKQGRWSDARFAMLLVCHMESTCLRARIRPHGFGPLACRERDCVYRAGCNLRHVCDYLHFTRTAEVELRPEGPLIMRLHQR